MAGTLTQKWTLILLTETSTIVEFQSSEIDPLRFSFFENHILDWAFLEEQFTLKPFFKVNKDLSKMLNLY